MFESNEHYKAILEFYKGKNAKRTQLPYMNHINEGLVVLDQIGASLNAKEGFCLHPIIQNDGELINAFQKESVLYQHKIDLYSLSLAMEYRWVANGYLSTRTINSLSEIKLSPLEEVQQMLVADKVQNRKDFELYHKTTHPRAKELDLYFRNWLEKLGISEVKYQSLINKILISQ